MVLQTFEVVMPVRLRKPSGFLLSSRKGGGGGTRCNHVCHDLEFCDLSLHWIGALCVVRHCMEELINRAVYISNR